MMRAATPAYLGSDFREAAPGHRFGLYYEGWNVDFSAVREQKAQAVKSACALPEHSKKLLEALIARQQQLAEGNAQLFSLPMIATSPFATGLGNEHPLENGFSFLTPYGLPYLPGSGVKGVIRRAAEELASSEWGETQGWSKDAIRQLFGPGEEDFARDRDTPARQGALRFWDVFPQIGAMCVEIMTPHLGEYYQGNATPNTSLTPNPIPFLAVPAKARFCFHVECAPASISDENLRENWRALLQAAFEHAGKWLGFGAKTAVGYGHMQIDEKTLAALEEEREKAAEQTALAALTPNLRRIKEFRAMCEKRAEQLMGNKESFNAAIHNAARALAKAALEGTDWTDEEKRAVADAIEEWLPKLVKVDMKDERKKLKLAALRGQS